MTTAHEHKIDYGQLMPALFVGHGSPMNAIDDNEFTRQWQIIGNSLPRPKAILSISAHWETKGTKITAMENPPTIHDFGGFPSALYSIKYNAKGSDWLTNEIVHLLDGETIQRDTTWGLDHGTWSVLRRMYPNADIPVVQLSLDYTKTTQQHYTLAQKLRELRHQDVLIIASGNIIHNLREIAWDKIDNSDFAYPWATEAKTIIEQHILNGNHKALIMYKNLGESVSKAIPTVDHFLPLLYLLALQFENEKPTLFNNKIILGSLSMTSVLID